MEFYQIRYFLAVKQKGNFTKAAQHVHVSQPSLTQAIKKLEDELGGALFIRDRAGSQLTALGRLMAPKLEQIYEQMHSTRLEAMRFSELDKIPLRIGIMHTIGSQILAKALVAFQMNNPDTELEIYVQSDIQLFKKLDAGDLDLLISSPERPVASGFELKLLYDERYYFTFSEDHEFNQFKTIGLDDLKGQVYLDRLSCEFRNDLTQICSQQNIALDAVYRSDSEQWILELVRLGKGVALMPEYTLPEDKTGLGVRQLLHPKLMRKVCAIYPHKNQHQSSVEKLLACLMAV